MTINNDDNIFFTIPDAVLHLIDVLFWITEMQRNLVKEYTLREKKHVVFLFFNIILGINSW